jgi:hypothetical protein
MVLKMSNKIAVTGFGSLDFEGIHEFIQLVVVDG